MNIQNFTPVFAIVFWLTFFHETTCESPDTIQVYSDQNPTVNRTSVEATISTTEEYRDSSSSMDPKEAVNNSTSKTNPIAGKNLTTEVPDSEGKSNITVNPAKNETLKPNGTTPVTDEIANGTLAEVNNNTTIATNNTDTGVPNNVTDKANKRQNTTSFNPVNNTAGVSGNGGVDGNEDDAYWSITENSEITATTTMESNSDATEAEENQMWLSMPGLKKNVKQEELERVEELEKMLQGQGESHFFAFILTAIFFSAVIYLLYHNKRKVIALVIPGAGARRTGSRRPYRSNYEKLETMSEAKTYTF